MKANKLRKIWADGGTVINGWLHIPSMWSAELMAHAGWDSITVDMQHGMHGIETVIQMMQAISTTETVPLARVNWNEPGSIMRLLDAGAFGIICPMINTRAECEAFVGACRYPPMGYRSLGPTRASVVMGADYADHANDEILTIAMIETREALENVEAIASVEGLDMLFVGTGDLRLSLSGQVGFDSNDSQVEAALDMILKTCEFHNLIAGIFTASSAYAGQMIQRRFRFVTVKTDSMILSEYAKQLVAETKENLE
ncbi:MAG: aldolase/citrate lyase family protein [Aggregatilineales bacterium]